MSLPTDLQNDVLDAEMGGRRRYNMINNPDGTVSFEDVTTYLQIGNTLGAEEVNAQNTEINTLNSNLANLAQLIKGGKVEGTTDAYGNISVPATLVNPMTGYIIAACSTSGACNVYMNGTTNYYVRVRSNASTPANVANTQVTIWIRYTP